ncbi:hypothetical protein DL769_001329 [Monosporascus sp. CRB-8-3]|nr:hypothetical protein DL769_001329 [Monosporascus sp. CRB-8-3]
MSLEAPLLHVVDECADGGMVCAEEEEPELQCFSQLAAAPSFVSQKAKQPSLLKIYERELEALKAAPFDQIRKLTELRHRGVGIILASDATLAIFHELTSQRGHGHSSGSRIFGVAVLATTNKFLGRESDVMLSARDVDGFLGNYN